MLISLVVAGSPLGTFKQNNNVSLIQTCADCTFNNITSIKLGDGSVLIVDKAMSQSGSYFNYSLNSTYTSSLGKYIVNGIGDVGTISANAIAADFPINALNTGSLIGEDSLDEFGYWDEALSSSQITALWNSGSGLTMPPASSCTGTLNTDWEIDLEDLCVISDATDIGFGNITFINTGNVTFDAVITANSVGDLPANQQGFLTNNARVRL